MAERAEQGTGKHPHKDTQEPYPHTKESRSSESHGEHSGGDRHQSGGGTSQANAASNTRDLKQREYRDEHGNIHHHTRTSEEMNERKAS